MMSVVAVVEGIRQGVLPDREEAIDGLALAGLGMFNALTRSPVRMHARRDSGIEQLAAAAGN